MTHPHRKQVRHYEQARHLHELTFSCDKRKQLLTNDVWRKILAAALTKACLEEQFRLITFVFMPEHVHLLVLPENPQSKVSRLLARMNQPASKQIRELLETNDSDLVRQLTVQNNKINGKSTGRNQRGGGINRNQRGHPSVG